MSTQFRDLPPCQIVPRLADEGTYIASESSFYRILKARDLLAHRGKSKKKTHKKPPALVATKANQIWSWDITYLRSLLIRGEFFYLYLFMDIFSRKIVGYEVFEEESMEHSSLLVKRICEKEGVERGQLNLHSDNGGPMKGATMVATLYRLGVLPSLSRPSVSNDNPYSESLFKTLKYCPEYPTKGFESVQAARAWVEKFVKWYNDEHLHSGIRFVTPTQKHECRDVEILNKRKAVYERARKRFPNRWSKETRNWQPVQEVFLNPSQKITESALKSAA